MFVKEMFGSRWFKFGGRLRYMKVFKIEGVRGIRESWDFDDVFLLVW